MHFSVLRYLSNEGIQPTPTIPNRVRCTAPQPRPAPPSALLPCDHLGRPGSRPPKKVMT